jgi:hemoglobin
MKTFHKGMKITESDWTVCLGHASAMLDAFRVPSAEREEVVGFVLSLKSDIVDA